MEALAGNPQQVLPSASKAGEQKIIHNPANSSDVPLNGLNPSANVQNLRHDMPKAPLDVVLRGNEDENIGLVPSSVSPHIDSSSVANTYEKLKQSELGSRGALAPLKEGGNEEDDEDVTGLNSTAKSTSYPAYVSLRTASEERDRGLSTSSTNSGSSKGVDDPTGNGSVSAVYKDFQQCEGHLRVRFHTSHLITHRLRDFYCVLVGMRMHWYTTAEDAFESRKLAGEICVESVEDWDGKSVVRTHRNGFRIKGRRGEVLECSAISAAEKSRWMESLMAASRVYQTFAGDFDIDVSQREVDDVTKRYQDEQKKTTKVGRFTAGAVVGGAVVGSLLLPIIGTAIGAAVGGIWVNRRSKARRNRKARAAAVRQQDYATLKEIDLKCYKCHQEFSLSRRREYCVSCSLPFCQMHCSRHMVLPQLGERHPVAVCDYCFLRQDFTNLMFVLMHCIRKMNEAEGNIKHLVQGKDVPQARQQELERLMKKPEFDLLAALSLLHFYRVHPEQFLTILAQMARFVETNVGEVEFYWSQLVGFARTLMMTFGSQYSNIQVLMYYFFIRAVGRRYPHLKLLAAWEYHATYEDAIQEGDFRLAHVCFFILLSCAPPAEFAVFSELWLKDVPEHQLTHILDVQSEMDYTLRCFEAQAPSTTFWNWLFAQSSEEIARAKADILRHVERATYFEALSIFPHEDAFVQREDLEATYEKWTTDVTRRLSSSPPKHAALSGHTTQPKTQPSIQSVDVSPEKNFHGMAEFVHRLTSIAEDLRHVERGERKKALPSKLTELRPHITGNLYIPICSGTDIMQEVVDVVESASTVFSTKARAPTLIVFEVLSTGKPISGPLPVEMKKPPVTQSQNVLDARRRAFSLHKIGSVRVSHVSDPSATQESPRSELGGHSDNMDSSAMDMLIMDAFGTNASAEADEDDDQESATDQQKMEHIETLLQDQDQQDGSSYQSSHDVPQMSVETWEDKVRQIREKSAHGSDPRWGVVSVIAKSFDDMRQEVFCLQLIDLFANIFSECELNLWLMPYRIVCTGPNVGLIQTLLDTSSIDGVKKTPGFVNLKQLFVDRYGPEGSPSFETAQNAFIESMAAYSLVSYFVQIKDRHNGNILLDKDGHIIHIDFGFMLGIAPGGRFSLETAPFKLTIEMVDAMGGLSSEGFARFRDLFQKGFLAARANRSKIMALVALTSDHSPFPCFINTPKSRVMDRLARNFMINVPKTDLTRRIQALIDHSYNHWGTNQYDNFQKRSNNIMP